MPVDYLTQEQEERYGRYNGEPTPVQLDRYFHLDDQDRLLTLAKRTEANQLGFAVQLVTVRFLGTFLIDPTAVPAGVVAHLAQQIGVAGPTALTHYLERPPTQYEHKAQIRITFGYLDFAEQPHHFQLVRWLYSRTWLASERPSILFDLTTAYLVQRKILLPGISVLERLVASVRERSAVRLWRVLARMPSAQQKVQLENLLVVQPPLRQSKLDLLRQGPYLISSRSMVEALNRVETIRKLEVGQLDFSRIPVGRLKELARYGASSNVHTLLRLNEDRRIATLLAFAVVYEGISQDDALDVLEQLTRSLLAKAEQAGKNERIRTIPYLDEAALQLAEACKVLTDGAVEDIVVRSSVYTRISMSEILKAIAQVVKYARPPGDNYHQELLSRYKMVRHFLPSLLKTIQFHAIPAGQPVLDGLAFLKSLEIVKLSPASKPQSSNQESDQSLQLVVPLAASQAEVEAEMSQPGPVENQNQELNVGAQAARRPKATGGPKMEDAPDEVVSRAWHSLVYQRHHKPHERRYYTFCVLDQLQNSLRHREVFIKPSQRWGDPRTKLLSDESWEKLRVQVCRMLGRGTDPKVELAALGSQLDAAYARTAANLPTNVDVRIEQKDGKDRIVLTPLEKLEESPRLEQLRKKVSALLPKVDLAEIILEIEARTNFTREFTHLSENNARVDDLSRSICAVLLAEACNVGLEPVIHRNVPALKRDRLGWVQQNYIRADTISRANALLVEAQSKIELARIWGGGEVASADGLRFVVPVRSINARANSKYFGREKGITYYNFLSDQFSGIYALVIPGTLRDSLYLLEGVLEQPTVLRPTEIMADTAAYSDVVFGLFWLLGYQFSPRIAGVGDTRYWRLSNPKETTTNYGPLEGIARNQINAKLIEENYDDLLRVAGSLKMGVINATELMRTLYSGKGASTLSRAIGEVGRIAKTLYLLPYIDDPAYRRRVLNQLNRTEDRHTLARAIFHGKRGEVRQRYREGQEDQLGALGLVLNIVVLWNTLYMDAALNQLRKEGELEILDEDVARLFPLGFAHCNMLGRYQFEVPEEVRQGKLRPLRNPLEADD